jgi:hypothetical protein
MANTTIWITRWRYEISKDPVRPGIWKLKKGGYLARVRAKDPRRAKQEQRLGTFETLQEALDWQRTARREIVEGKQGPRQKIPLHEYAAQLFDRKVSRGDIRSASGHEVWANGLAHILGKPLHDSRDRQAPPRVIHSGLGDFYVSEIKTADIKAWLDEITKLVQQRRYSPRSVNDWLAKLRVIFKEAVIDLELPRNPMDGVQDLDLSGVRTYTKEQPNSLTPDELPLFLNKMRQLRPGWFAMTCLGFATGLRPSSMRTLRRQGPEADLDWKTGILLVRRSHSRRGGRVMDTTKTGKDLELPIADLLPILRWHVDQLPPALRESDLLFPGVQKKGGVGYMSPTALQNPFRDVAKAMGLKKKLTPRSMRRTHKDLMRRAGIDKVVGMAISGHETEEMHRLYSTVSLDEQKGAMGKIIDMGRFREALEHGEAPAAAQRRAAGE